MKEEVNKMFPHLNRPRFFTGKLLSSADLETEQEYFIKRMKLHNRYLHGCGVVAGLNVTLSAGTPPAIVVSAGYALDAEGNDVLLASPQQGPLPVDGDAACLCLRWAERETDQVPVPGEPTGSLDPTAAAAVEEVALLKYESECPSLKQKKPCENGIGCDNQHGFVLARLLKRHGAWKIDSSFRARRVCKEA
jgi:hypothetical protein